MSKFIDYLKSTNNIIYQDKQIENISKIYLSENQIEKLEQIKKEIKLIVFADIESYYSSKIVGILEKISFFIPVIEIEYITKYDKKNINDEFIVPTIFKVEGIKTTLIFNEILDSIIGKNEKNIKEKVIDGIFDEKIIDYLIKRIGE